MDKTPFSCIIITLIVINQHFQTTEAVKITHVSPSEASAGGATITIHGGDFASSEFNHGAGKDHLGNKVDLLSLTKSYSCAVRKDETTEVQIVCDTPERMVDDDYYVKVTVDGELVPLENHCGYWRNSRCRVKVNYKYTPSIQSITPQSGPPDAILTVRGRLFSDRRGSHLATSSNGLTEKFLRAYVGGYQCDLLVDPNDDKRFLVQLDDEDSNDGFYKCQIISRHVGTQNVSFIIEGRYGRSRPALDLLRVSGDNRIYNYQSYAEIQSVSPSIGSTKGGNSITITGRNFEDTHYPIKVLVGDEICEVTSFSDTEIVCISPPEPAIRAFYPGNRGNNVELWEDMDVGTLEEISSQSSPDNVTHQEDLTLSVSASANNALRVRTFFVPPSDNTYHFTMSTNADSKLFFSNTSNPDDKTDILSTSTPTSSKIQLNKGSRHYMELVSESSGDSSLTVGVCVDDTDITSGMTEAATSEKQRISVRSTVTMETQTITLADLSSGKGVSEVQRVDVLSTPSSLDGALYRLGLAGVFTEPLSGNVGSEDLQTALLALPRMNDDSVTVKQAAIGSGIRYTITFTSQLGNVETLSVKSHANQRGEELDVNVQTTKQGVVSELYFSLSLDNIESSPISTTATKDEVEKTVLDLFSERCPNAVDSPFGSTFYNSYETTSSSRIIQAEELESGDIINAFCGKYFYKNPNNLYKSTDDKGIYLSQHKTICFAHLGSIKSILYLEVAYKDSESKSQRRGKWYTVEDIIVSDSWRYVCVNMLDLVNGLLTGASQIFLHRAMVTRETDMDIFIDSVYIGAKPTTTDFTGLNNGWTKRRQALPSGHVITDITVTSSDNIYTIVMTPRECGYNFKLFDVVGGQVSSGSNSQSSQHVVYNYGSGSINVEVVEEASPPVTGDFQLTFDGRTKTVPVMATAVELQDILHSLRADGTVATREGNCANFDWHVTWKAKGGNQPTLEITSSSLSGRDVVITNTVITNGMLCYNPIPAEFLRTVHDTPQIMALINNIPTTCTGSCDIEWSAASTPTITSVTPTSGTLSQGTAVTISGTKFSSTLSENTVVIGGVSCNVTASTTTSITCNAGNGPQGTYDVFVVVHSLGLASQPDPTVTFTYVADVVSLIPESGSTQGGTDLSISGHGIQPGATVTVNDNPCPVTSNSPSEIVCVTPASSILTESAVDVIVTQNGASLTTQTFTYSPSTTATISSISPNSAGVMGGVEIVISGSSFGVSAINDDAVKIGEAAIEITSYSDTEVRGKVRGQAPGSYPIRLKVSSGYADTRANNIGEFRHILEVTGMFPPHGSLHGGTRLTLTGSGFSLTEDENVVMVGHHLCAVETSTDTKLVCLIDDTSKVHVITNGGQSPEYGVGFAWDSPYLQVEVGDILRWQWNSESALGLKYRVQRTETLAHTEYDSTGFNSGATGTSSGAYEYRFTETGTYSYWSGYLLEDAPFTLRGEVEVISRTSHTAYLSVMVAEHQADYNTASGESDPTGGSCPGDTSSITGCTVPKPTAADSSKFSFAFWECVSPTVTGLSPIQGTGTDDISISGTGFTTSTCESEVYLGEYLCDVTTSSANQINALLDSSLEIDIGKVLPLKVRVGNRGNALVNIIKELDRSFVALPFISALSPSSGSLAGGTELTLTGGGFKDSSVTVGGYPCEVTAESYSSLTCVTGVMSAGSADIMVSSMASNDQFLNTECKVNDGCVFLYSSADTPTVSGIAPTSVNTVNSQITLTGSGFGTDKHLIEVGLGPGNCTVETVTDTEIVCQTEEVPAGSQSLDVTVKGKGVAHTNSISLTVEAKLTAVSPNSGSVYGGNDITITGNGFLADGTTVTIGSSPCDIKSVNSGQIVCTTQAHADGAVDIVVSSGTPSFSPTLSYSYSEAGSPVISSISPASGLSGQVITITGTGFTGSPTASVNGVDCPVSSSTATSIDCTIGSNSAGSYPVIIQLPGVGNSNDDVLFTYTVSIGSINPSSGSFAGGQVVEVSGSGFDPSSTGVTICDQPCQLMDGITASLLTCITPPGTGDESTSRPCDVVTSVNTVKTTLSDGYTYDPSKTPALTSVLPSRGGTAGGSVITVTGQGFSTPMNENSVLIGGVVCSVTQATSTEIQCTTGASSETIMSVISVSVEGKGQAKTNDVTFWYVDVWSSQFTWGGNPPPVAGDFVILKPNQTVLLDISTPVLKMLLIQGGEFIFDEADIELQAENILVTDGGLFQIGTESEPFQHKATITLHGQPRSLELPIYGTKNIAIREGTLDLHGKPIEMTWTLLSATATAGSSTLQLVHSVDWKAGDQIVIATTGDRHSQKETEQHKISAVSGDGMTITMQGTLVYTHVGVSEDFDGQTVEFRAEVGLLSRNIVVRGSDNVAWHDPVEACEKGFNTGEFSVQTCFQGRFGEEVGSDQFGGHIIMHAPRPNEGLVIGHIEYVEFYYMGQAFRLGRYPVHFHLNGDMSDSYVRGCGFRQTFNRIVNIHGTHNLLVEHNVAFNVMGGAFFLEDGVETGNIFQYNLALNVQASSSLQNDDITPAAFWLTNPNNTVRHNHAAGGSHFGIWYRMFDHPHGPSFDPDVCPKQVPLGLYQNNTFHSLGWFGVWIFEDFFPMVGGGCSSTVPTKAVFDGTTAWNCEKGAEFVNAGSVQFINSFFVNNKMAGVEGKLVVKGEEFSPDGPLLKDTLIVARADSLTSSMGATRGGVVLPYNQGYTVQGVKFVNFDEAGSAAIQFAVIAGKCAHFCSGFTYHMKGISMVNSPNIGAFEWTHQGVIMDLDGSLSGISPGSIVPTVDTLPPSKCQPFAPFSVSSPASFCEDDVDFVRFSFNAAVPESLWYKDALFVNDYGNHSVPWAKKRISHPKGWATTLVSGQTYTLEFKDGEVMENISYTARFDLQKPEDYVVIAQRLQYLPDRFSLSNKVFINQTEESTLTYNNNQHGDWKFVPNNNQIEYLVSGKDDPSQATIYRSLNLNAYRCYYENCEPPPDPNSVPPTNRRPSTAVFWSDVESWKNMPEGWGGNQGGDSYGLPVDDDDVWIPEDMWLVVDITLPRIKKLYIYGVLELDGNFNSSKNSYNDFRLSAEYIYIVGGRLIAGWPDDPFKGNVEIVLRGSHASPRLDVLGGPEVGAKAIGVFGGLDLHGKDVGVSWTRLSVTANPGDTTLTLVEAVSWVAGDEIVVTPTGYDPWETETFMITSVSAQTVRLNDTIKYKHVVFTETVETHTYEMNSEVGLLTRNVKVIGEAYPGLFTESFGARVLVGFAADSERSYLGFARVSNVEFDHTGQEGFTEDYDPRHSLSFLDCGTVSDVRPSYVKDSVFHHGFSTAIGVYSTNGLEITNNIVHHVVGIGIDVHGDNVLLMDNLVTLSIFSGSYQDRFESGNVRFNGAIDGREATNLRLTGNVVSGSERAAFRVLGESCDSPSQWKYNVARSSLSGVFLLPDDGFPGCLKLSGFSVHMCSDFGLYINTESSAILSELTLVNNILGVFPMVIGPDAVTHQLADKFFTINNSLIVGTADSFDCSKDVMPSGDNIKLSSLGRSNFLGNEGKVGIVWPSFTQKSNMAPEMSYTGLTGYPAINGVMTVSNVIFAHFANKCGRKDVAIATNPNNDDGMHPINTDNLMFFDTPINNKIFIHRPNLGSINPSDCVDMDCDGIKKAMLTDTDGSLLDAPGVIFPQSEWEWDGDKRRGLGDYRIPKTLLTRPTGERIPVEEIAPNKGIFHAGCNYVSDWQAYQCPNTDYKMMIIESMDEDTETRRVSPVAVLIDGYIDLINGPQDHGWCSGYTCRKRLSTFMSIVPTNKEAAVYFTSTSPQSIRLHLLNSAPDDAVLVSIWYSNPQRLDIFYSGDHVLPTNGYYDNQGKYQLRRVDNLSQGKPQFNDLSGSNYFDRSRGELWVLVKGPTPVLIATSELIVVVFEATQEILTIDEFFGENLVNNLVAFLGIDPSKVRLVDVIAEGSTGRRKRRNTNMVQFYVEIGNSPKQSVNQSANNSLSTSELANYTRTLVNAALMGTLNLNTTMFVVEPLPSPGDPAWEYRVVTEETSGTNYIPINPIDRLAFEVESQPLYEDKAFSAQPKLKLLDTQGSRLRHLGTTESPWELSVTLQSTINSHLNGTLTGNKTVSFVDGWAEFSDLTISHPGTYILDFTVTSPPEAVGFTDQQTVVVPKRPLMASIVSSLLDTLENSTVEFTLDLRDHTTMEKITDLGWRGHSWMVTADLPNPQYYWGTMYGTSTSSFNSSTALVTFSDLQFSNLGTYHIRFRFMSTPSEYDFYILGKIHVMSSSQANITREKRAVIQLKFREDYNTVITSEEEKTFFGTYVANYYQQKYPQVIIISTDVQPGSILVILTVEGNTSQVDKLLKSACEEPDDKMSFNFGGLSLQLSGDVKVDGKLCDVDQIKVSGKQGLLAGEVAAIAVVSVLVVALVIVFIIWRVKVGKNKTVDDYDVRGGGYQGRGVGIESTLFRENTFDSLKPKGLFPESPLPPSDTTFPSATSVRPLTAWSDKDNIKGCQ